jgi:hypothetical protein
LQARLTENSLASQPPLLRGISLRHFETTREAQLYACDPMKEETYRAAMDYFKV